MKLSLFTDIGLRTLMRLAGEPDRPISTPELAAEFKISRNHLTKVVSRLSSAGFVNTRRGNHGGISLARPANQIRIGQVVSELESGICLVDCFRPDGGTCTLRDTCSLPARLHAANLRFIEELDKTLLSDIAYHTPAKRGDTSGG